MKADAQHSPHESGRLTGEVVAITGASRGLGTALARACAREGAAVALCARSAGEINALVREIDSAGGAAYAAAVDVTDGEAMERWVAAARAELGPPSVLISNASVLGPREPLAEHDVPSWRRTIDVNLTGSFLAVRAVLPGMLEAGRGSIVQLSSGAAVLPRRNWGAYSVSKHAVDGLMLNLAEELAGTGVRVNSVDPGAMRTAMRAAAYPQEDPQTLKTPAETVDIFVWLASAESADVTGQRFRADDWIAQTG